jgi:hypothetical protein
MFIYFITTAVIPFADDLKIGRDTIPLRIADLNVGVLYIFSMASLAVYGVMLAGWSSNNKYSFLGGLRASSQMISYEITLSLSVVSLFMLAGSVDINDIVKNQGPDLLTWNVVRQPLAFLLFLIASFAETNRTPFDLPEGRVRAGGRLSRRIFEHEVRPFHDGRVHRHHRRLRRHRLSLLRRLAGSLSQPRRISSRALPYYLRLVGYGFAAFSTLAGIFLISRFVPRNIEDARRFEVLVLGIPALVRD